VRDKLSGENGARAVRSTEAEDHDRALDPYIRVRAQQAPLLCCPDGRDERLNSLHALLGLERLSPRTGLLVMAARFTKAR
jgi:hypothetical protein